MPTVLNDAPQNQKKLCFKEQDNSVGVCRKTQEREEWRKAGTGGGEEVLGKEELRKSGDWLC
jgi:hypothetical protein